MPFVLLWIAATAAIWITIISQGREHLAVAAKADVARRREQIAGVVFLLACPPTLICAISSCVLLLAAPTVQFNAGNPLAMDLWSFWVDAWQPLYTFASILAVAYSLWTVVAFLFNRKHWSSMPALWGLISSLCGWFILGSAFPSA